MRSNLLTGTVPAVLWSTTIEYGRGGAGVSCALPDPCFACARACLWLCSLVDLSNNSFSGALPGAVTSATNLR
jgi:hypothetical protein